MSHYAVRVEIHHVSHAEVDPGATLKCRCIQPCRHAQPQTKRETTEVLMVTVRADTKPQAVSKAIKMLEVNGED